MFLESKHLSIRFVKLKPNKIGMYSIVLLIILNVLKIFTSHKITARGYVSSIVEISIATFIFDALTALKTIS